MKKKDYSSLYDLLLECCRHEPDTLLLEIYTSKIDDWDGFLYSAYAHGVFPLVHKALKSVSNVPEKVKSRLKNTNLDIARRNMTMTAELLKVMKLLEEHSIPALAIKGPVLSQMIYGDVTQRQYADLDILLHADNLYRATELLMSNEYTYEYPLAFTKNKALFKATKDITLRREHQGIDVEIHWRLFSGRLFKKSNIDLFTDNKQYIEINNYQIPTLDEKVLILYLLLHGSKHMWERLEWIVDIDRLVRSQQIDWDMIMRTAKMMQIEPMIQLGCAVAYDLFQTPFPKTLIQNFEQDIAIVKAKKIVIDDLYLDKIFEEGRIMNTVYYLGIGKINKSWYESSMKLMRYSKEDVYSINLPNFLSFLYHLVHLYNSLIYRIKKVQQYFGCYIVNYFM